MNTLYRALNINNDQELEALVESLDLTDSQYIHFMSALNEDLSEDGMRYVLENLTKSFDNGSYEKLVEQFKKKPCVRKMKKVEEDTVYDHSWYEVKGGKYPKRTKEGVVIKEGVENINQKVLDELYDIISDQMGKMYLANYDEVDFDNLLDSVDDFGNDIDGYNPALKKDYALALKAKWEKDNKDYENDYILDLSAGIFESAKEEIEEPIAEEPVKEEKPVSTADPEIAKFIDQTEKVADNTMNPEILQGLSDSVEAKIPLATDVEQMNKLGELKVKIDTKLSAAQKAPVVEGYEYNPDDEEYADVGDKVEFDWNKEGEGDVRVTGTVREVQTLGGNRYYNIASYNPETERVETYYRVDPVSNDMKRVYELDETASCGATCCGSVASVVKPIGKTVKRKNKKKLPEAIDTKLFKESIYTDTPAETVLEGHKMKYFMNESKWYLSCDNALVKTFDKNVMIESIDQILDGETPSCGLLEGYSCYEMNLLMEDISTITVDNDEDMKGIGLGDMMTKNPALFATSRITDIDSYKDNYDKMTADEKNEKNELDREVENNIGNNMDYVDDTSAEKKQVKVLGLKKLDNGDKLAQVQDLNSNEVKDVPTTTLKKV